MRMIISPTVAGNILMWQTWVTDAPKEIGTTCLCNATCGYQNAAKSTVMLARCVSQVVNMGPSSMHTCPGLPRAPPDNARNILPYPKIKGFPIQGPERAA